MEIQKPNPKTSEAGNARLAKTKKEACAKRTQNRLDFPSPVHRRVAQTGQG
jgi:hypothetical protein